MKFSLLVSKLIPSLILKRWYDWRTVLGSGFILTLTLSLMVAAAKIGEDIHVLSNEMASALILLAIITCMITPALFKKVFPFEKLVTKRRKVAFFGANQLTLPLAGELNLHGFDITVYHNTREVLGKANAAFFTFNYLKDYSKETLEQADIFSADIVVVAATSSERDNVRISEIASKRDVQHIVARVEIPKIAKLLRERGIHVVSSFFSTKAMMRAMIVSPDVAMLFVAEEKGLNQILFKNPKYHLTPLSALSFFGDAIVVRIIRSHETVIPHGNTSLQIGDHLIVTGSDSSVQRLRLELGG